MDPSSKPEEPENQAKGGMDPDKTAMIFPFNDNLEITGLVYEKQRNGAMLTVFCANPASYWFCGLLPLLDFSLTQSSHLQNGAGNRVTEQL